MRTLRSIALAQIPNLLKRVFLGPVRRHSAARANGILWRIDFLIVLDSKPEFREQREPPRNCKVEADAAGVDLDLGPISAPKATVGPV